MLFKKNLYKLHWIRIANLTLIKTSHIWLHFSHKAPKVQQPLHMEFFFTSHDPMWKLATWLATLHDNLVGKGNRANLCHYLIKHIAYCRVIPSISCFAHVTALRGTQESINLPIIEMRKQHLRIIDLFTVMELVYSRAELVPRLSHFWLCTPFTLWNHCHHYDHHHCHHHQHQHHHHHISFSDDSNFSKISRSRYIIASLLQYHCPKLASWLPRRL